MWVQLQHGHDDKCDAVMTRFGAGFDDLRRCRSSSRRTSCAGAATSHAGLRTMPGHEPQTRVAALAASRALHQGYVDCAGCAGLPRATTEGPRAEAALAALGEPHGPRAAGGPRMVGWKRGRGAVSVFLVFFFPFLYSFLSNFQNRAQTRNNLNAFKTYATCKKMTCTSTWCNITLTF
jgi:hypothetical protein